MCGGMAAVCDGCRMKQVAVDIRVEMILTWVWARQYAILIVHTSIKCMGETAGLGTSLHPSGTSGPSVAPPWPWGEVRPAERERERERENREVSGEWWGEVRLVERERENRAVS